MIDTTDIDRWLERYQAAWLSDDPVAIAAQVLDLFGNPVEASAMRKRAYLMGRDAIWPRVAQEYLRTGQRVRHTVKASGRDKVPVKPPPGSWNAHGMDIAVQMRGMGCVSRM